jgi:hypothetical protein
MSLKTLEAEILRELRTVTGLKKLSAKSIQEWSTSKVDTQGEEKYVYLPTIGVHVSYLEPK